VFTTAPIYIYVKRKHRGLNSLVRSLIKIEWTDGAFDLMIDIGPDAQDAPLGADAADLDALGGPAVVAGKRVDERPTHLPIRRHRDTSPHMR